MAVDDPIQPTREEGTGTTRDEVLTNQLAAWLANSKRTYDEYQKISLEHSQNAQVAFQRATQQAQQELASLNALTLQAIQNSVNVTAQAHQNAVETANLTGKSSLRHTEQLANQHTAHRDLATDAAWEDIEEGAENALTARAVTIDDAALKAIGAAVAAAVTQAIGGGGNKPAA